MIAGFVLAKKGKLDKWLTVRWAEPVPAEGEAVTETAEDGDTATDEAAETAETETESEGAFPLNIDDENSGFVEKETSDNLEEKFEKNGYKFFVLPTDDIRDKRERHIQAKTGVATEKGELKEEYETNIKKLVDDINALFS